MSKDDKLIMVVKKEILFRDKYFEGFISHMNFDYESAILKNLKYLRRGDVEKDISHKQPIGYSLIVNPELKKVFAYKRSSKDKNYGEKRLQGKWSWGVGGHIEKIDIQNGNPIHNSAIRELTEEVEINGKIINQKVLGYINDDSNEVGQVHFGILYLIETDAKIIKPRDSEIEIGKLKSMEELEKICLNSNVEDWSKIAINPLIEYFNGL